MKLLEAQQRFSKLEQVKNAYRSRDIGLLLDERGEKLRSSIRRLIDARVIERIARDLYWHPTTAPTRYQPIEEIAALLRFGCICFIGMESAASRWGVISQIPVDRLTVVTSGREGLFCTPFGSIEYIHTKADAFEITANTIEVPDSPLKLATKQYTVAGLKRARRSLDLIIWEELADEQ